MGILNVTPDSFSDGGQYQALSQALSRAEHMLAEGVDMIDIGGESTRPHAPPVSIAEEMDRVFPVLERLQGCGVPLSLDTRRTEVMRAGLSIGVDLINDVSALEDQGALTLLAGQSTGICLMHKQGNPADMQDQPSYSDVLAEVSSYLNARVAACLACGIARERLLVDPGFGFGKTLAHNLTLLRQLSRIKQQVAIPLLVGLSRKSMLGTLSAEPKPEARLGASVAAGLIAVQQGASVLRVHDVKATCQALAVYAAVNQ